MLSLEYAGTATSICDRHTLHRTLPASAKKTDVVPLGMQAQQHPFVTGTPFTGPFQPLPDARPPPPTSSAVPTLPVEAPFSAASPFWSQPSSGAQHLMPNSPEAHAQV